MNGWSEPSGNEILFLLYSFLSTPGMDLANELVITRRRPVNRYNHESHVRKHRDIKPQIIFFSSFLLTYVYP
jgi:hypothetical protein